MKYRKFGETGFNVSALGFGCMRFPTTGSSGDVDEPEAIRMVRHGIDSGINYVDTAHGYHGGNSERVLGKALQDGYREKVRLATKLPIGDVKEAGDFDRLLGEQFDRLQTDCIDFYLLHNLQAPTWPKVRDLGVLDWLREVKAAGKIGEMGFSYHDDYDTFVEIIDANPDWVFCQIQYNYMNEEVQAGTRGLEYAASKGLAVIVMEPLMGGCLAQAPEPVKTVFDSASISRTPVDWALQWLWHKPEIALVLSGMSTMQQVEENLASADTSGIGILSKEDLATVARAREAYAGLSSVPCTKCGYCMPCPTGVDIPGNMHLYNASTVFGGNQKGLSTALYRGLLETKRAAACVACGECEPKCPQSIPISEWMTKIDEAFRA